MKESFFLGSVLLFAAATAAPVGSPRSPPHHYRHDRHERRIEDGPGAGPWEKREPAELGLDGEALDRAEEYVNVEMAGRQCFMVVKDGYIVKEAYRLGEFDRVYRVHRVYRVGCDSLLWS